MSDQSTETLLAAPRSIAAGELKGHALRMKRHHLVVRHAVKRCALDYAAQKKRLSTGKPRFTRVSEKWIDRINARVRALINAEVDRLPANGRTIV